MPRDQEFIDMVWIKARGLEQVRGQEEQKKKEELILRTKKIKTIGWFLGGILIAIILLVITVSFSIVTICILGSYMMSFSIYYECQFTKGDEHVL